MTEACPVQGDHLGGQSVEVAAEAGRRQNEPDARVLGDEGDPVLGKAGSSGT